MQELLKGSFIDLLPPNLKNDPESIAIGKAFDSIFDELFPKLTNNLLIFANIDNLGHEVLDILAPDLHVDVYDKTWSLYKKREVCKNSQRWHLHKGTLGILKDVAKPLIGDAEILEWSQYNGLPTHFKIFFTLINDSLDAEKVAELKKLVEKYKNLRSKLDGLGYKAGLQHNAKLLTLNTIQKTIFIEGA